MKSIHLPPVAVLGALLFPLMLRAQQKEEQEKEPAVVMEARKLLENDKLADAQRLLESRLKSNPGDHDARVLMAQVESYNGEVEKAAALLEAGLKDSAADTELLWYLAHMRMQLGEDGPNVTRTRGTVSYKPSSISKEKEEEWKVKQWGLAVEAWRKFLKWTPDHEKAAKFAARSLAAWKGKGHLEELAKLREKFPDNSSISLSSAEALVAAGRAEEALDMAQQQTKAQPRSSAAWSTRAKVLEALHKKEEAADATARAKFYDSLPPCAALDYAPEIVARLTAMEENPAEEAKKLLADKSDLSNALMAVLCWRHIAHGPVEDSCFAEITARKKGELLCDLAAQGQSICTYRGCCLGLAKLKHARAFDVISGFLTGDNNPIFHINAAPSLALLGDVRAVPLLVKTLAPEFREKDRQRPEQEEGFMGLGPLLNRIRCGFALAVFDLPEVRLALTAGAKNDDIAPCCEAALYRITKDPARLRAAEAALARAGKNARLFRGEMASLFNEMATPEAKEAAARVEKGKSGDEEPDIIEVGK